MGLSWLIQPSTRPCKQPPWCLVIWMASEQRWHYLQICLMRVNCTSRCLSESLWLDNKARLTVHSPLTHEGSAGWNATAQRGARTLKSWGAINKKSQVGLIKKGQHSIWLRHHHPDLTNFRINLTAALISHWHACKILFSPFIWSPSPVTRLVISMFTFPYIRLAA